MVILLSGTVALILLIVGWILGSHPGAVAGLLLSLAVLVVAYMKSESLLLGLYRTEPFENRKLGMMVKYLSREAKIPAPRLFLSGLEMPNSFSVGKKPRTAAIVVTKGLLGFGDKEIRAVLAREIARIKSSETLNSGMAAVLAFSISYFAQKCYFRLSVEKQRRKRRLYSIPIFILAPPAAFLLRMSVSPRVGMKADWHGALLSKNPEALASALRKASAWSDKNPLAGFAATSHVWLVNPFRQGWFNSMFSVHPLIERRVERLEVVKLAE